MSKKEELSEQYRCEAYEVSPTRKRCQHNNEVIAWNNEIVGAFEAGYDAGKQEIEHIVWQISEANFEKGKEIGKKEVINKACEFIQTNVREYHKSGVFHVTEFIKDLRKVMEE